MTNFEWYQQLNKPFLSPPAWIFSPVWIILYAMIIASFMLYMAKPTTYNKTLGYVCFFIQIILNLLWSPSFFIAKNMWLALVIIIFMDIFVYLTIKNFYNISKFAAILLIPYFIWILFATYLNIAFIAIN